MSERYGRIVPAAEVADRHSGSPALRIPSMICSASPGFQPASRNFASEKSGRSRRDFGRRRSGFVHPAQLCITGGEAAQHPIARPRHAAKSLDGIGVSARRIQHQPQMLQYHSGWYGLRRMASRMRSMPSSRLSETGERHARAGDGVGVVRVEGDGAADSAARRCEVAAIDVN